MRESEDITNDRETFAKDLKNALDRRLSTVQKDETLAILEIFDAQTLVKLRCREVSAGKSNCDISEGEIEDYGIRECEQLLSVIAEMKYIQGSGFNFDHRMAHKYLSRIKEVVHARIWEQLCPEWFVCTEDGKTLKFDKGYIIKKFTADIEKENQLDGHFIIEFENLRVEHVKLFKDLFYQSFYCNEKVYSIAKPELYILMDIALAKGGPEAIPESFYASMRCQQQPGWQTNENLVRRTKVNWCLPSLVNCESIISKVVSIYHKGDEKIRPPRANTFFTDRGKKYKTSKVVDRVESEEGRCPFLFN